MASLTDIAQSCLVELLTTRRLDKALPNKLSTIKSHAVGIIFDDIVFSLNLLQIELAGLLSVVRYLQSNA